MTPPNAYLTYVAKDKSFSRFLRLFPLWVGCIFWVIGLLFGFIAWGLSAKIAEIKEVDPVAAFGLSLALPGLTVGFLLGLAIGLGFICGYFAQKVEE